MDNYCCGFDHDGSRITVYSDGEKHFIYKDDVYWFEMWMDDNLEWTEKEGVTDRAQAIGDRVERIMS